MLQCDILNIIVLFIMLVLLVISNLYVMDCIIKLGLFGKITNAKLIIFSFVLFFVNFLLVGITVYASF
jgi:hypothetical protein